MNTSTTLIDTGNDLAATIASTHRDWNGLELEDFAYGIAVRTLGATIDSRQLQETLAIMNGVRKIMMLLRELQIRTLNYYPSSGGLEAPALTKNQEEGIIEGIAKLRSGISELLVA